MKKTFLLAIAAAGVFTSAASANAGDTGLSPKAQSLADSLKTASGATSDVLDRSIQGGSPRAIALAESVRKAPGTTTDVAHNARPALSPKDPSYEQAALGVRPVRVAPLK
jgi:hypothetical protein